MNYTNSTLLLNADVIFITDIIIIILIILLSLFCCILCIRCSILFCCLKFKNKISTEVYV